MNQKTARILRCPNCGKSVKAMPDNPWRPFCSERCKLIDLGEWIAEEKRIPDEPGPAYPPEDDEGS